MEILVFMLCVSLRLAFCKNLPEAESAQEEAYKLPPTNLTEDDPNKEMYVIHAMVYQVGIITNKTDSDTNNTGVIGNQEALTFYHTNGSNIDLSQIPEPLMTNVTAQRMVGVAPTASEDHPNPAPVSWAELKKLAATQNIPLSDIPRHSRHVTDEDFGDYDDNSEYLMNENMPYLQRLFKRSLEGNKENEEKSPVKIVSGAAVIPQEAGVQSIGIPPLLMFNNNFTEIPVPIPNTSVVHYAKVNTVINHTP
ncbi:hypothetical protein NE865_06376 [Phthorimaea operculella]|nr:hypothetical protein NE865_06376 [Phthorimaea operculella]